MNGGIIKDKDHVDHDKYGWIGVDFDGTLVEYTGWQGIYHIGKPVKPMMDRVKQWLKEGKTVKIFTARAKGGDKNQIKVIKEWMKNNGLPELEITNVKDRYMDELWDDKCVQVVKNKGIPITEKYNE